MTSTSAALGEVGTFVAGSGFPLHLQGKTSGSYPFAKVGDISRCARSGRQELGDAEHWVDDEIVAQLKAKVVPASAVLFAKIGEAIQQNFRVIASRSMLIDNNAMAYVASGDRLDHRYAFHFLKSIDMYRLASSTTVPSLRKSTLEEIAIPLPPLPEQRRIAAILDKADALRAKRRVAIAKLDQLLQSVFLDMFGDPVTNPKGWPICLLRDAAFFQEGPGILAKDFREHGIPLVRLSGVKDSARVTLSGCNYLDPKMVEKKWEHFRLTKGDIVILTSASLGHAAVVDDEAEGAIPYTGIIRLRPISDDLTSGFLKTYLTSPWFSRQAQAMASGAVIKHFGPTHMKVMTLPMPSRSVQERYAVIAGNIGERRIELVKAQHANESLFQSVQQNAFSGGLDRAA